MVKIPTILRSRPAKAVGVLLLAGVAALLVTAVVKTLFFNSTDVTVDSRPRVGSEQPPAPTDLQVTRDEFGPWTVGNPSPGVNAEPPLVLLLNAGSIDASRWVVKVDNTWVPAQPFQVLDVAATGSLVQVKVNNQKTYKLTLGQPFIFDSAPKTVYAVTFAADGRIGIVQQTTTWAKAHGQKR